LHKKKDVFKHPSEAHGWHMKWYSQDTDTKRNDAEEPIHTIEVYAERYGLASLEVICLLSVDHYKPRLSPRLA